jgi:hypothetical protein
MSHINYLESDEGNTAFMISNISYCQFGTMCVHDKKTLLGDSKLLFIITNCCNQVRSFFFLLVVVKTHSGRT